MKRRELEHVIRAAGTIAEDHEIVVVGSQAILGQHPDASGVLTASMEADVYPKNKPELADLVDGSIGEGSPFHETFGYYAQGVGPETAVLPEGWESRATRIGPLAGDIHGLCIDTHDLAISKLVAGREKDDTFVRELVRSGWIDRAELEARLARTKIARELRAIVEARLRALFRT
ncbi:hypothetical protein L6R52_31605 [Myxococcota bacterium]|nr:hypothetical protein [Myxococcota bacterium]